MFMINRVNRIVILLHWYCCSRQKLSTILIANVANAARFVTLTFWFKIVTLPPLPPNNGHLVSTATFFCPQGDRCGDVQLLLELFYQTISHRYWKVRFEIYQRFIQTQTYRIFYFSRRLFAKQHTLGSWCRIFSYSRSRSRKIQLL